MKKILLPAIFAFMILSSNQNTQAINIKANHLRIAGLIIGSACLGISILDNNRSTKSSHKDNQYYKEGVVNGWFLGLGLGILVSTAASLSQN